MARIQLKCIKNIYKQPAVYKHRAKSGLFADGCVQLQLKVHVASTI